MRNRSSNAFFYAAIVTLGGLVFGLDLGVIAGGFAQIRTQFGLNDIQIGNVGAAPGFGAIFALLFVGLLSDRIGRKRTIQLIALLYLASAVCSALAPSYSTLVAARFVGGLAFCSLALASMYIGEISPASIRGRLVAINQLNIGIGLLAAYLFNFFIDQAMQTGAAWATSLDFERTAWRWMLGMEIPFAFLWLVLLTLIPKSPRWLMSVGREEEAQRSMARLMPASEIPAEMAAIKASLEVGDASRSLGEQLSDLFSRNARRAVVIGAVMAAVQPITGINAINTYAPIIFEQTGATDPLWQTVWLGVVSLIANIAALLLVDRLGRRPVVVYGLLWCVLSLGVCAWGFQQARYQLDDAAIARVLDSVDFEPRVAEQFRTQAGVEFGSDIAFLTGMREALGEDVINEHKNLLIKESAQINAQLILFAVLSFMAAFQFSIGPVMWVVLSEIFPTRIRALAITGAQLLTASVNYFVQKFFPWQLSNMGARDIFLFYAACVAVGLIALAILLPETKHKSIEEIEAELGAT